MDRERLHELVDDLPEDELTPAFQALATLMILEAWGKGERSLRRYEERWLRDAALLRLRSKTLEGLFHAFASEQRHYHQADAPPLAFALKNDEGEDIADLLPASSWKAVLRQLHFYRKTLEAVEDERDRRLIMEREGARLEEGEELAAGVAAELERLGLS